MNNWNISWRLESAEKRMGNDASSKDEQCSNQWVEYTLVYIVDCIQEVVWWQYLLDTASTGQPN
jgi:hypothetical protein